MKRQHPDENETDSKKRKTDLNTLFEMLPSSAEDEESFDPEDIYKIAKRILEIDSQDLHAHSFAFTSLYDLGKYEECVPHGKIYLDSLDDTHFRQFYAIALKECGEFQESKTQYELILKESDDLSEYEYVSCKMQLAHLLIHHLDQAEIGSKICEELIQNHENALDVDHFNCCIFVCAAGLKEKVYQDRFMKVVQNETYFIESDNYDAFNMVLLDWNPEKHAEVQKVMSNLFENLLLVNEHAYQNWAKLMIPHKQFVERNNPNIVKTLRLYFEFQKEFMYSVETEFSTSTIDDIISFLFNF